MNSTSFFVNITAGTTYIRFAVLTRLNHYLFGFTSDVVYFTLDIIAGQTTSATVFVKNHGMGGPSPQSCYVNKFLSLSDIIDVSRC